MQLPISDELNIGYLSRLFDNTSNCYKFFWFQAILRKLNKDNKRFSFDELINEMIADAWYMVTEYHLRLGPIGVTDNLEEVVKYIGVIHPFPSSEKREKIIEFLQECDDKTDPSVPGIAEKMKPPIARDLERVRKYWCLIIKIEPSITDIYGHVSLANDLISVDHFVPWQFVAHDELWNLHPTTKEINSSKNNSLPSWEHYFERLGNMEYHAYKMCQQYPQVSKAFETCSTYHLNNQEIRNQLYCMGLNRKQFIERLEKAIEPVYESAKSCGFREWVYTIKEPI